MSNIHKVQIGKQVVTTHVIKTANEVDQSLRNMLLLAQSRGMKCVVALDIEKEYNTSSSYFIPSPTRPGGIENVVTVMLCCGTTCLIIQLSRMDAYINASCCLSKFLQCVELTFVGVRIQHCLQALERDYGIRCRNAVELGQLPRKLSELHWSLEGYALVDIANKVKQMVFLDVDKAKRICNDAAFSDWGATTLSHQQIEAATLRTYLCFYASNCLYGGYLEFADF